MSVYPEDCLITASLVQMVDIVNLMKDFGDISRYSEKQIILDWLYRMKQYTDMPTFSQYGQRTLVSGWRLEHHTAGSSRK